MRSALLLAALVALPAHAARIKDLVEVQGSRDNALVGLGIVVGLDGSGDDPSTFLARRPLATLMKNLGAASDAAEIKAKNVAIVMVTAQLPAFARAGVRVDVTVSSIGTANSLMGGTLVATALKGLDRQIYAVAQGPLLVGGYDVRARTGSMERKNAAASGRIQGGAVIERDAPSQLPEGDLVLLLKEPDPTTASRIRAAIDRELGPGSSNVRDPGAVVITASVASGGATELLARVGALEATPDAIARVVIDERSGAIVVGDQVRLGPAAIAYGALTIRIREGSAVSQPGALARGTTQVVAESEVQVDEQRGQLVEVAGAATVGQVAAALNALGVRPRDLVPIFQALRAAGALAGELKVL